MNYYSNLLTLLFFIGLSATLSAVAPMPFVARTVMVQSGPRTSVWPLESADGFIIANYPHHSRAHKTKASVLSLSFDKKTIYINGKDTRAQELIITPINGLCMYAGRMHHGSIRVRYKAGNVSILNYDSSSHKQRLPLFSKALHVYGKPLLPITTLKHHAVQKKVHTITHSTRIEDAVYKVRVLLDESPSTAMKQWILKSPQGFVLIDPQEEGKSIKLDTSLVTISEKNGFLYINNRKILKPQFYIVPVQGRSMFNGKTYGGGFLITHYHHKTMLINNVDLEEYICGVVKSESWPGWPMEINKVMAIVCRTYAISMVQRAKNSKLPYHIKDTKTHQVYNGVCDVPAIKDAVYQTKGVFLAYNNKPILAMFDCCCGGAIPAKMRNFEFHKAPYLKRGYVCNHCKDTSIYTWQARYSLKELTQMFQKLFPKIKTIQKIRITKKDEAGVVHEIALYAPRKVYTVTGKQLYALMQPAVKSYSYSIAREGDTFTIKGKGFGHQLGLCQWGGREMVRKDFGYKDILQFYYPNTKFMCLVGTQP